jgi:hypothetical protein
MLGAWRGAARGAARAALPAARRGLAAKAASGEEVPRQLSGPQRKMVATEQQKLEKKMEGWSAQQR